MKKLLLVLLAFVLAFSLMACDDSKDESKNENNQATSTTQSTNGDGGSIPGGNTGDNDQGGSTGSCNQGGNVPGGDTGDDDQGGSTGSSNQGGNTDNSGSQGGNTDNSGSQGGNTDNSDSQGGNTDNSSSQGGNTDNSGSQGGNTDNSGSQGGNTDNPSTSVGTTIQKSEWDRIMNSNNFTVTFGGNTVYVNKDGMMNITDDDVLYLVTVQGEHYVLTFDGDGYVAEKINDEPNFILSHYLFGGVFINFDLLVYDDALGCYRADPFDGDLLLQIYFEDGQLTKVIMNGSMVVDISNVGTTTFQIPEYTLNGEIVGGDNTGDDSGDDSGVKGTISKSDWDRIMAETSFTFTMYADDGSYVTYSVNGSNKKVVMYENGETVTMFETVVDGTVYQIVEVDGVYYGMVSQGAVPINTIADVFAEAYVTYDELVYNNDKGCYEFDLDGETYSIAFENGEIDTVVNMDSGESISFEACGSTVVTIPQYTVVG